MRAAENLGRFTGDSTGPAPYVGVVRWLAPEPGSNLTTSQMINPIRAIQNNPMNIHMNGPAPPIPDPYQPIMVMPSCEPSARELPVDVSIMSGPHEGPAAGFIEVP